MCGVGEYFIAAGSGTCYGKNGGRRGKGGPNDSTDVILIDALAKLCRNDIFSPLANRRCMQARRLLAASGICVGNKGEANDVGRSGARSERCRFLRFPVISAEIYMQARPFAPASAVSSSHCGIGARMIIWSTRLCRWHQLRVKRKNLLVHAPFVLFLDPISTREHSASSLLTAVHTRRRCCGNNRRMCERSGGGAHTVTFALPFYAPSARFHV